MSGPEQRPYGLQVVIRAAQNHRRELLQTLEGLHREASGPDSTCRCELYEDSFTPNCFVWVEWWPRSGDVKQSLASTRFTTLMAAAGVLGSVESVHELHASPRSQREVS